MIKIQKQKNNEAEMTPSPFFLASVISSITQEQKQVKIDLLATRSFSLPPTQRVKCADL